MTTYAMRFPVLPRATAALVLAVLLAGIPTILLLFFWPLELPSVEDLAMPAEPQMVKPLLLGVVWVCWGLFGWGVLAELIGMMRATRTRVRTPFHRLAAHLITTMTLAATTPVAAARGLIPAASVAVAPAALPDVSPVESAEARTVEVAKPDKTYVVKPRDTLWGIAKRHLGDPARYREIARLNQGQVMNDGQTFTSKDWLRPGWKLRMPIDATGLDWTRRRSGRVHTVLAGESLWDIAEKRLGDGNRYKEIYKLNKGREQPDGGRLGDPAVIEPGWRLILPDRPTAPKAAQQRPATGPAPCAASPAAETPRTSVVLPDGGVVGLSFAAGVAVALAATRLHYRRRLSTPQADEPVSLPVPEPEPPAVRVLEQAHRREYASSDEPPPDDLELVRSAFSIDPPVSVKVGTRGSEAVSLELSGLNVGLIGPAVDDVIRAIVLDLLAQADQHRVEIVMPVDDAVRVLGEQVRALSEYLPELRLVEGLDDAIDCLEEQFVARRRILRDSEADDIPELRGNEPDEPLPALLLVAQTDGGGDYSYLGTLMGLAPRFGIGALLGGEWPSGTTYEVSADSVVSNASGELAGVALFHVSKTAAGTLLEKLAAGNGFVDDKPQTDAGLVAPTPEPTEALVQFGVVGEPIIEVEGKVVDISGRTKSLELFVLLALHPHGLDREKICAHLWPDVEEPQAGYRFHAALKDLRAALREATGRSDKEAAFVEAENKVYRVEARNVAVDLWAYRRSLDAARSATDAETKLVALEGAAALCRGQLAQGTNYGWIDQDHRWPLTVTSVRALLHLGAIHEQAGRLERALEVFEQVCTLDADVESAAIGAIRVLLKLGRRDEAHLRARHLKRRLDALGIMPSTEAQAVLGHLNRRT
ncbi:LysM peptidoglycan-binding domain-containing protein [Nonomuraea sp. CA-141351]|uniref:LysM peptidoglycan-binding domain-containing protein n=1 Tax=Nonomuraea sp. CA-141351 TaxID=3239996 RepID=UPI003D8F15E6